MPGRRDVQDAQDRRASATEAGDVCRHASATVRPVHFLFSGVPDDGDRDPDDLAFEAKIVWLSSLAAQ